MKQKTKYKEIEIGKIPEEWSESNLGELGELKNGVNFNRNDFGQGFPIINVTNLFRGRYATIDDLDEIKKETIKKPENYFVRKGDILFTRSSLKHSGTGQAAMVNNLPKKETLFSGFIIRFRKNSNAKINEEFLNYLVRSEMYRDYMRRVMAGTTITNINQQFLSTLPIILPPLPEQQRIAKILSDLDSKIELNQQMNKTLEAIAQAIFKHWFVDFEFPNEKGKPYKSSGGKMVWSEELQKEVPKGWEVKPIDEIADFLNGLALQKFPAEPNKEFLPVIKIRELRQGVTESSDRASLNIPEDYIVNDGDILFSWSGSLEVEIWGHGKGALNQHLFKVNSKTYPKWFSYHWILQHLPQYRHIAEGKATTMGHIQRHHLKSSLVLVPPKNTLERMDSVFSPVIDRIINAKIESRNLVTIRDLLLPQLMSGKIRVEVS